MTNKLVFFLVLIFASTVVFSQKGKVQTAWRSLVDYEATVTDVSDKMAEYTLPLYIHIFADPFVLSCTAAASAAILPFAYSLLLMAFAIFCTWRLWPNINAEAHNNKDRKTVFFIFILFRINYNLLNPPD
jgi:hypothetical protein